jgi:hypothetical protein
MRAPAASAGFPKRDFCWCWVLPYADYDICLADLIAITRVAMS